MKLRLTSCLVKPICTYYFTGKDLLARAKNCPNCSTLITPQPMEWEARGDISDGYCWRCPKPNCRKQQLSDPEGFWKVAYNLADPAILVGSAVPCFRCWGRSWGVQPHSHWLLSVAKRSLQQKIAADDHHTRWNWQGGPNRWKSFPIQAQGKPAHTTLCIALASVHFDLNTTLYSVVPQRQSKNTWEMGFRNGRYFYHSFAWVHGACTDRTASTLLPIIQQHVLPGTTINSDEWSAYRRVGTLPNVHQYQTVNHLASHFRGSKWGSHANVECGKLKLKRMKGVRAEQLPSYLDKFM